MAVTAHKQNRKMRDAPSGRSWVARPAAPRKGLRRRSNGTLAMWQAALRLLSSNFQDHLVWIMECMPMIPIELCGAWQLDRRPISVHPISTRFLLQHLAHLQRICEYGTLSQGQIPHHGNKIRACRRWSQGAIVVCVLRFWGGNWRLAEALRRESTRTRPYRKRS